MKSLPKYHAERVRLLSHLETQKQLINGDMTEIKTSLRPLTLAKHVINEAADSFRDNNFATQTTRLALSLLPFRRSPLIGIAAQIAIPLIVRNIPTILNLIRGNEEGETTFAETKVEVIGRLRKVVSNLRERIAY